MYNLPYHKTEDQEFILDFMSRYPFAFLTTSNAEGNPVATQIPLLVKRRDEKWFLQGHVMKNTDHHKALLSNPQVLAVFTGPHAYVSATWYSNPYMGSTWNYMSVHVRGKLSIVEENQKVDFMKRLSLKFEDGNRDSPTFYDNLGAEYHKRMMPAIDVFEIEAEHLDHVLKLSQERDEESIENIILNLENRGGESALLAEEMKRWLNRNKD
jgi:transcriptional regulator